MVGAFMENYNSNGLFSPNSIKINMNFTKIFLNINKEVLWNLPCLCSILHL